MTEKTDLPYRPCAGIALTDGRGRLWAGERIDTPGAWQMSQGGIDEGESPREAALRELEEEIGVGPGSVTVLDEHPDWLTYDLPDALIGKVWKGRWRGQRQRWFLARLDADESAIRIDVPHPEFSAWRWMTPDALLSAIVDFKRPLYAAILERFGPRLGPRPD